LLLGLVVSVTTTATDDLVLRFAVTTTTDNTGLITHLIPFFEAGNGFTVRVMAGGTGKALRLLANGDADVALTHAPTLEIPLIDNGLAVDRHEIMTNDFVLVGPADDPARVRESDSAADALAAIAHAQRRFVSRGDDSGTHIRERRLWQLGGISPGGGWYLEAGQGMGKTLQIADELGGYTLTDRGTWLRFGAATSLEILFDDPAQLLNVYSVIRANKTVHPHVNERGAAALTTWLRSAEAAGLIDKFRVDGQRLFIPAHHTR
jgi:tungstate transport system substrate-binding protein